MEEERERRSGTEARLDNLSADLIDIEEASRSASNTDSLWPQKTLPSTDAPLLILAKCLADTLLPILKKLRTETRELALPTDLTETELPMQIH